MMSDIVSVLIHNSLNEILHGLPPTLRVRELLASRRDIERFAEEWAQGPSQDLIVANKELIIACMSTVLTELGEDEFETRVGVNVSVAEQIMQRISCIESGP